MKLSVEKLLKLNACQSGIEWYEQNGSPTTVCGTIKKLIQSDEGKKYNWCNWLLTHLFTKDQNVQYAIFAAESVIGIYEKKYPNDYRPRNAIKAAKEYLSKKTKVNRNAANAAAYAAAYAAADAAYAVANAAANAFQEFQRMSERDRDLENVTIGDNMIFEDGRPVTRGETIPPFFEGMEPFEGGYTLILSS